MYGKKGAKSLLNSYYYWNIIIPKVRLYYKGAYLMECIISTMEDTYILSLDHSLISGLITSSMFTLNTEKEDRKEKKNP